MASKELVVDQLNSVKGEMERCARLMSNHHPHPRAQKLLQDAFLLVGRAKMAFEDRPVFLCDSEEKG
jgi:hypothetical protein